MKYRSLLALVLIFFIPLFSFSDENHEETDPVIIQLKTRMENYLKDISDFSSQLQEINESNIEQRRVLNRESLEIKTLIDQSRDDIAHEKISLNIIDQLINESDERKSNYDDRISQYRMQIRDIRQKEASIQENITDAGTRMQRIIDDIDDEYKIILENVFNELRAVNKYLIIENTIEEINGNINLAEENIQLLKDFSKELIDIRRDLIAKKLFLNEEFLFSPVLWTHAISEINRLFYNIPDLYSNTMGQIKEYYRDNFLQGLINSILIMTFIIFLIIFNKFIAGKWQRQLFAMSLFQQDKKSVFFIRIFSKALFNILDLIFIFIFALLILLNRELLGSNIFFFIKDLIIGLIIYKGIKTVIKSLLKNKEESPYQFDKKISLFYYNNLLLIMKLSLIYYIFYLADSYFHLESRVFELLGNILLILSLLLFYRLLNYDKFLSFKGESKDLRHPVFIKAFFIILKIHIICIFLILFTGYVNLGLYIIEAMLLSIMTTIIAVIFYDILKDLFLRFFDKEEGTVYNYLSSLGYRERTLIKYRNIIIISGSLLIIIVSFLLISRFYGVSSEIIASVIRILALGFTIGDIRLSIITIVMAVLMVILSQFISKLIQRVLDARLQGRPEEDISFQRTFYQLSHYMVILIGILFAVKILGFDLTNFAILGGALGVGIGFGLQNIVNNFISGLILMFEQPIKIGDIIEVGDKMGTVKKINIRSTVITTFDRIDLILPNSDLISSKVSNWTHNDPVIRVRMEIGISYGSDVELATRILLETAEKNEFALKDPPPRVIFSGFGNSSLDFLLLVFANISDAFTTRSTLNYAIIKAFRENKIEIPFPQRDLHIKSMPKE